MISRIAITPGEPAGVGPDLVVALAARDHPAEIVAVGDPGLLAARAALLGIDLRCVEWRDGEPRPHRAGNLPVVSVPLAAPAAPGRLDPTNAPAVLRALEVAADGCLAGEFDALATGPVHKGVINDAGIPFTGHTEFLAARTGAPLPVMMLVAGRGDGALRVALATTHLPLREVPAAITADLLRAVVHILDRDLRRRFGIERPRITVCGLNPHAGEGGHLGREEVEVIAPLCVALREEGIIIRGPLPADTAFTPASLAEADVVLAMYHDQGLPVLKHVGFGRAVNVTLGLPIVRVSVDHGTALDLAATGRADGGSLAAAVEMAIRLAAGRKVVV